MVSKMNKLMHSIDDDEDSHADVSPSQLLGPFTSIEYNSLSCKRRSRRCHISRLRRRGLDSADDDTDDDGTEMGIDAFRPPVSLLLSIANKVIPK